MPDKTSEMDSPAEEMARNHAIIARRSSRGFCLSLHPLSLSFSLSVLLARVSRCDVNGRRRKSQSAITGGLGTTIVKICRRASSRYLRLRGRARQAPPPPASCRTLVDVIHRDAYPVNHQRYADEGGFIDGVVKSPINEQPRSDVRESRRSRA